jgi:hypothetical protein
MANLVEDFYRRVSGLEID